MMTRRARLAACVALCTTIFGSTMAVPRASTPAVTTGVIAFAASLSSSSACHRDASTGCDLYLGDLNFSTGEISNTLLIDGSSGAQWFPALSPDGRLLAYSNAATTPDSIVVIDLPSRSVRQVISDAKFPAFSADSARLYFSTAAQAIKVLNVASRAITTVPTVGTGSDPAPIGDRYIGYHEEVGGVAAPLIHDLMTTTEIRPATSTRCGHVVVNPGQTRMGCAPSSSTRVWMTQLTNGVWSALAILAGPFDTAIVAAAPEFGGAAALFLGVGSWPTETVLVASAESGQSSGNPDRPFTTTRGRLFVIDLAPTTPVLIPTVVRGYPDAQTYAPSVLAGQTMAGVIGTPSGTAVVTPAALRFAATKAGSTLTAVTASQTLTLTFSAAPSNWVATSNQPWLTLAGAAGSAAGQFTASISNPADVIGISTTLTAAITVTASTSPNSPVTIPVTLTIVQAGAAGNSPFGQVDSPAQNATGVQGAVGVTGWVLDNIGVTGVKIYRNCLLFENQASCQIVLGHNVVEIGDAAFLSGARPDVEAAFSTSPQNHRAGWGYLMLTSMLPHVSGQRSYGGQGTLTVYVVATDVEGNRTLLGRSSDPASAAFAEPTSITMANDSIAKPFGAIDTPAQGATVSGVLNNFGWALTPDSNTTAGGGDILIPTDGSTMTIFIDGLPTALVTYNQCRGSVGNPVPAGQFCNDDVSNIFGNTTPSPVLTARTSNPTLFRNLDAARAPIGSFTINTATLANGLHTIAWSVTDSEGRTEGIGSRFFSVLNPGADPRTSRAPRSMRRPRGPRGVPRARARQSAPGPARRQSPRESE